MKKSFRKYIAPALAFSLVAVLYSCRKGEMNENQLPDTQLAVEAINLSGENRLNSEVQLNWFGTDKDGYIVGYEISLDQQNWFFTTSNDSTFTFELEAGQDTADINFYVRSVDNEGAIDPTPAYLGVPIKNTPPAVSFSNDRGPRDTAFIASTIFWRASDLDGDETVQKVFIRFNDGDWTEIQKSQNLLSFMVDTAVQNGTATADIFYGKNLNSAATSVNGLKVNADNEIYIKVTDLAGAESQVDTSDSFFLKNKTPGVQTLWVSGHIPSVNTEYRHYLDTNSIDYDHLNYGADQGARQPVYWDPTFRLILKNFNKLFVTSPNDKFENSSTGQNTTLLNYIAPMVQEFSLAGNKIFVTTSFAKNQENLEELTGPYPIEGLVTANGQARLYPDSLVYPVVDTSLYPNLRSEFVQSGVVPLVKSSDAERFYEGDLTPFAGWSGDNLLAVRRRSGNVLREVFFAIELHKYDDIDGSVEELIEQIFNEF